MPINNPIPAGLGGGSNVVFYLDVEQDTQTLQIPDLDLNRDVMYQLDYFMPFKNGGHAILSVNGLGASALSYRALRTNGGTPVGVVNSGLTLYSGGQAHGSGRVTFMKGGDRPMIGHYSRNNAGAEVEYGGFITGAAYSGSDENMTSIEFHTYGDFALPAGSRIILTKPLFQG